MKKLSKKNRRWFRTKAVKGQKANFRNKIRCKKSSINKHNNLHNLEVPNNFSILNNNNETLRFFDVLLDIINKSHYNDTIKFDMSKISNVTIDAIIYLIFIIKNSIKAINKLLHFEGNMPNIYEVREFFETSGFYKYVIANYNVKTYNPNKISIQSGINNDPSLITNICNFVSTSIIDKIKIRYLYTMLIELMGNTKEHAYETDSIFLPKWFIYIEDKNNYYNLVFMDTGVGIPTTVNRKMLEKVYAKDSELIKTALYGKNRSKTLLPFRGKGLPKIFSIAKNKYITDLIIESCKGVCMITDGDNIKTFDNRFNFNGTLFNWKIYK